MKILLATDGSAHAEAAGEILKRLPLPAEVDLTLLTVIERIVSPFVDNTSLQEADQQILRELYATQEGDATDLLEREAGRFATTGWTVHTAHCQGQVAQEIVQAADELGCDLVAIGARGLGKVGRFFLGSVSDKVVQHASCSVLVAHLPEPGQSPSQTSAVPGPGGTASPVRILVAYDDSPVSAAAVQALSAWPLGERAAVTIVTVLPLVTAFRMDILQRLSTVWQEQKRAATARLEAAAEVIRRATPQVAIQLQEAAEPAEAILQLASELDAELIVLGHNGTSGIARFLLGSVATRVVREAHCAVLIARH